MSAPKSLGFLTRVCEPPEFAYNCVFLCTFFLGRVSIISITYSSGPPTFIRLMDCAKHKPAWGSVLGWQSRRSSGLGVWLGCDGTWRGAGGGSAGGKCVSVTWETSGLALALPLRGLTLDQ